MHLFLETRVSLVVVIVTFLGRTSKKKINTAYLRGNKEMKQESRIPFGCKRLCIFKQCKKQATGKGRFSNMSLERKGIDLQFLVVQSL